MALCLGIDVGGTFTDAVLTDGSKVSRAKSPTVARRPRAVGAHRHRHFWRERADSRCPAPAPDRPLRAGHDRGDQCPHRAYRRPGGSGHDRWDSRTLFLWRRGVVCRDGIWSVYPEAIVPRDVSWACASGSTGTVTCSLALDPEAAVDARPASSSRNTRSRRWRCRFCGPSGIRITNPAVAAIRERLSVPSG